MRALALSLALAALAPIAASAQTSSAPARQCFFSRDWRGWKAVDDKSMYIRIGLHDLYRVEFKNGCPGLTSPNAHLITQSRTGDNVCSALDLDIKVSDLQGFSTPCRSDTLMSRSSAEQTLSPVRLWVIRCALGEVRPGQPFLNSTR